MDINKNNFVENTHDFSNEILEKISTGRAILFTGAGFSSNTVNLQNTPPLQSKELAKKLCEIGQFKSDDELGYASDRFIKEVNSTELIKLLKNEYTLKNVSSEHIDICGINWLRFYTTNYDKSIEISCTQSNKKIQSIDLSSNSSPYGRDLLCVHLNGDIDSLNEDVLEKGFKITNSSYVSADSFLDSTWRSIFKRDLERSSAIVFVGYSMSDFEIQKILIENEDIKKKTYFIVSTNFDGKEDFVLSKYGNILHVGIKGFAGLVNSNKALFETNNNYQLQSIHPYEFSNADCNDISDIEIDHFLMYGRIDKKFVDEAITGEQIVPYIINRDLLSQVFEYINNNVNIIILGEFGNGKSVFLKQLKPYLSSKSINVYELKDEDADYISDIEEISKNTTKKYLLVLDDYERYLDLIEHSCHLNINNVTFVLSSRYLTHDSCADQLEKIDFKYHQFSIDELSENEIVHFIDIIENLGLWGQTINDPTQNKKIKFIRDRNGNQISKTLLALMDSPQMKSRVSTLLNNLLNDEEHKDTIFTIILLNILGLNANFSLISEVAENDSIYDNKLLRESGFKQLFHRNQLQIMPVSSLFCIYLIKTFFSATYTSNKLLNIAKLFNVSYKKNNKQDVIFKGMLKFSFVEKIFPDDNKKNTLKNYYQDLKNKVSWLRKNPHFWLQYGMSYITFNNYSKAQTYFDNAYSLAEKKHDYHTKNIDTQQARLWMLQAMKEDFEYFNKSHRIFVTLENDNYKFRQLSLYKKYFKSPCYQALPKNKKVIFEHACKSIFESVKNLDDNYAIKVANMFELMIDEIKADRLK